MRPHVLQINLRPKNESGPSGTFSDHSKPEETSTDVSGPRRKNLCPSFLSGFGVRGDRDRETGDWDSVRIAGGHTWPLAGAIPALI
jgi:hypothetical protein